MDQIEIKIRLDAIRRKLDDKRKLTKKFSLITVPYTGSRTGCFCYHPKNMPNPATAYDEAKVEFLIQLEAWYEVVQIYEEDQKLSEKIVTPELKKDVAKLLEEFDHKRNPYLIEALGEMLWDKSGAIQMPDGKFDGLSEKSTQHSLDYMAVLERRAEEIKYQDYGIILQNGHQIKNVIKHTFTG